MQVGQVVIRKLGHVALQNQTRNISCSPCLHLIQKWRRERGLPMNPNAYGVLTDGSDYSFVDGRPTPYGIGHKKRIVKQKQLLDRILQLNSEMDFAMERHKKVKEEEAANRQKILDSKLKPKGVLLLKNKE